MKKISNKTAWLSLGFVCSILLSFIVGYFTGNSSYHEGFNDGYDWRVAEECDITQADLHNLKATSEAFSNLAEEVDWLKEANNFKKQIADLAIENCEMIENLILDGFDPEFKYTGADIEEALEYHGFYQNIEKIDSLMDTQL